MQEYPGNHRELLLCSKACCAWFELDVRTLLRSPKALPSVGHLGLESPQSKGHLVFGQNWLGNQDQKAIGYLIARGDTKR